MVYLYIVILMVLYCFLFEEWSEADVVERYLKPIGMDFMAKAFIENKISGSVLMSITEDHIKEMGCAVLG